MCLLLTVEYLKGTMGSGYGRGDKFHLDYKSGTACQLVLTMEYSFDIQSPNTGNTVPDLICYLLFSCDLDYISRLFLFCSRQVFCTLGIMIPCVV